MSEYNPPIKPNEQPDIGFSTANIRIDDLPDLPIGILVCQPLATKQGRGKGLKVSYCNGFAASLLDLNNTDNERLLDDIPYLTPLLKPAREVLATGFPGQENIYLARQAQWISCSVRRMNEQVVIYLEKSSSSQEHAPPDNLKKNNHSSPTGLDRPADVQRLSAMQQAVLEHAALAITVTDINGIIQHVNPALEIITGYKAEELIGKVTPIALRDPVFHESLVNQLKEDLVNDVSGEELIIEYIKNNKFLRRENVLLTRRGQRIPVLSTISGLYDDGNTLIGLVDIVADISYLKTIENKLMQANQRSQLATMAGKLGVWEWNLLTNELVLDDNFFALFGLAPTTVIKHLEDLEQLVHPDDLAFYKKNVQEIITTQKPFDVEFRVLSPDTKSVHYLKADGLLVQNEEGESTRMIGVLRDRTTKRLAGQALKASEKRYRYLVNHLQEVVFQTDSDGIWTYLNPAWETIMGFDVDESTGTFFLDYVLPQDHALSIASFKALIAQEKKYCKHEIRYRHKEGGFRWIEVFAQVIVDENTGYVGTTGTLTDITERKKAEEAILESEQRFRDIAENVDEIFWIRDLSEPRFLYINHAYEKFTGQSADSVYANPLVFLDFIIDEDRDRVLGYFVRDGQDSSFQFQARHKDGSLRHMSVRLFRVMNEDNELIRRIGVATDITTAIEKELILEESLNRERTLNALKSQFISTASHEFRTPLAAINSSVELVKHYVNVSNSDAAITKVINHHIDKIYQKVFFLNDLITDTLTISKIDEGKINVNLELTDVIELYENTLKLYFSDREDKRFVECQVVGTAVPVNLDRKLTEHILTNLLSNAFKFSTTNPRLTVYFARGEVTLEISDEGIGIPKKDILNLFGKFFRASNVTSFQGTGLGLAICQEYISLQRGRITCESTEGVGTSFRVSLPLPGYGAIAVL